MTVKRTEVRPPLHCVTTLHRINVEEREGVAPATNANVATMLESLNSSPELVGYSPAIHTCGAPNGVVAPADIPIVGSVATLR